MKIDKLKYLLISTFFLITIICKSNSMESDQGTDKLYEGNPVRLFRTNSPVSVSVSGEERSIYETPSNTQSGGEMKVVSDNTPGAPFLLESDKFIIQRGDLLIVKYCINIETCGHIALGFLNTARNGWIGPFHELKEGLQEGVFKTYVELEHKETSLVIRNFQKNQSIFTIKNIEVKKVLGK